MSTNNKTIRSYLSNRGFGFFTNRWRNQESEIRTQARKDVEKFIDQLDVNVGKMDEKDRDEYVENLFYYVNGLITGIAAADGHDHKQCNYPKDFEKLGMQYLQKNYLSIFDHFRKTNVDYEFPKESKIYEATKGKKFVEYSSHPYYHIDADTLVELAEKLKTIGWTFSIRGYSHHFPSHTIRIVYHNMKQWDKFLNEKNENNRTD